MDLFPTTIYQCFENFHISIYFTNISWNFEGVKICLFNWNIIDTKSKRLGFYREYEHCNQNLFKIGPFSYKNLFIYDYTYIYVFICASRYSN